MSRIKEIKKLKKVLEKKNKKPKTPEERKEKLKDYVAGRLLIQSTEFIHDEVDLKDLCAEFEICSKVNSGKVKTSEGMYQMYDLWCNGYNGDGRCTRYQKPIYE